MLGADATAEQITQFEQAHGLDRPFLSQYAAWLGDILRGDFGKSFVTGRVVATEIANALPVTLAIVIFAFLIVAFNLIADLLYGMLDPRIRYD